MKRLSILVAVLVAFACTGDDVDDVRFAIDSDHSGSVDCADLDHADACLHDPHAAACDGADVNHDGVVDDADVHDIYAGLEATGHHCTAPEHHDDTGDHATHH